MEALINGNVYSITAVVDPAKQVAAASADVANTAAVATLAAPGAGITNFVTGLLIAFTGATAAGEATATLAGVLGGTISIPVAIPAGVTAQGQVIAINFNPPLPANAANVACTLTLPALGAGNAHAAASLRGFTR